MKILSVPIKQKLFRFADIAHLRLFGYKMDGEMRKFIRNLSWSFFGGIIAAGTLFAINILVGRWLGPEEYGKYNTIMAVFYFLIIPMGLGLDTAVSYYISKNEDKPVRNDMFSSAITVAIMLFLATGFILTIYLEFFPYATSSYTKDGLFAAFLLASFFVARGLVDAILRGLHYFKTQSKIKILESIVIVAFLSILFIFFRGSADYRLPVFSLIFGYMVFIFVSGFILRKEFRFSPLNERKLLLMKYGSVAVLGTVSGFLFFGMDKIIVQSRLGFFELGLYSAYFSVSISIAGQLGVLVANVLFPVMAKISEGRRLLLGKMNKTFAFLFLPLFVFFNALSFSVFLFLGPPYQYFFSISAVFSFAATIFLYFNVLWWFIASEGRGGVYFTSVHGIISGTIFLIILLLMRKHIFIEAVPFALSIALCYGIIIGNSRVYNQKLSKI